jgi:predicted O-methyltransferase YrrM
MNKAKKLHLQVMKEHKNYKVNDVGNWVERIGKDSNFYLEMTNYKGECIFYQWLACLVRIKQPQVVVEMGADQGGSAVFILSELPQNGHLYSVDSKTEDQGWSYVPKWEKRITKIVGNDIKKKTYPKDFPWKEVDLWFLDSVHSYKHVKYQIELIRPHLRKGVIIIVHDVCLGQVGSRLKKYPWDYWEDKKKIFNNGVGMYVI